MQICKTMLLCLALAGCASTASEAPPAAAVSNVSDAEAFGQARTALLARLKDADSAKITNMRRVGEYVCGEVNSKNGFGGYTGAKRFSVSPNGEALIGGESVELGVWTSPCWRG